MKIRKQNCSTSYPKLNSPETSLQKFLRLLLYYFAYPLLKVHLKLWYGFSEFYDFSSLADASSLSSLSYKNCKSGKVRRELKKLRGSLVVCNHISLLDAAMAGVALWPLRLQILSLAENGQHKIYSPLVRAFGTVFVGDNLVEWRGMAEKQRKALKAGECVLIFPEGELFPYTTELNSFQNGSFRLASFYDVPLICVTLVPTKKVCLNRLLGRPGFNAYVGPVVKRDACLERRAAIVKLQEITEGILTENLGKADKKR